MSKKALFAAMAALTLAIPSSGCGDDDAEKGNVRFTTWGEEYIEEGLPASEFPKDGWSVKYSKFLVVIRGVAIADAAGEVAATMSTPRVFDLTKPGEKEVVTFTGIEAKNWDRVSYQMGPMTADATLAAGVSDADRQLLLSAGAHLHVEGAATKGAVTKSFKWTFAAPTLFDECEGEIDGKKTVGVLVTNGGTDTVQLTMHGDHLFYDDLQAANAILRFEAISKADANADGEVTLAELSAVRLTTIAPTDGAFGTGSAGDVNTLKDFVVALSRTVGHYRGEGECFAKAPR